MAENAVEIQQAVENEIVSENSPYAANIQPLPVEKIVDVRNIKTALRMLSKVIRQLQLGTINDTRAKTLIYALVSYKDIYRESEFEERIKKIETKIKAEEKNRKGIER